MRPAAFSCRRIAGTVATVGLLSIFGCESAGRGSLLGSKGTPWTIRCLELRGANRLQQIERVAETLRRTPGVRSDDVFVREEGDAVTRLYYGTYYRRTDPKTRRRSTPRRMREDLDLIRQFGDEAGRRYFLHAMPVIMPTPDVGNPEWELKRVPAEYSLQVAVFEPTDDFHEFKRAAAEFCAYLRKKGYEAYYHHANASSMVTVGSFGPEAVITRPDGRRLYSDEVLALQRDELLRYNLLNGAVYRVRTDSGASVRVPSVLVEIPRPSAANPW